MFRDGIISTPLSQYRTTRPDNPSQTTMVELLPIAKNNRQDCRQITRGVPGYLLGDAGKCRQYSGERNTTVRLFSR
ncbi:MAG: hypothetical protein HY936_07385 [Nitrosomonadales bacterium]|nr:hypothetical protein [Nitrosomonadales bacterium]